MVATTAFATIDTPLGPMEAGADESGIRFLEFGDRRSGGAPSSGENVHLAALRREIAEYFAGRLRRFTVPLSFHGSAFQRRVWEALLEIPYGATRSYDDLARAVGTPGASRAVGRANGSNPFAIVVPCHRVVRKDGGLGGYGGGLHRKRFLLELERRHAPEAGLSLWGERDDANGPCR